MAEQRSNIVANPVLIISARISGLVLAQHLRREGIPFRIFERDADLDTRWGLTLHWSLQTLRALLPEDLVNILPDAYVDRKAVEKGAVSRFPFFDLSTGKTYSSNSQGARVAADQSYSGEVQEIAGYGD